MDRVALNEKSFLEYCLNAAASVGGRFWGDGPWRAVEVPDSFLYTCVFGLNPEPGEEAALAAGLRTGVQSGQLPDHILFDGRNAALSAALEAEGFAPIIAQTAMSRSLEIPVDAPKQPVIMVGPDRVREWVDSLNVGMGVDPTPYFIYETLVQNPNIVLMGVEEGGRIVSTLCLAMVGGMACLHEASTLPEMRGRGMVSDMFRRAMLEARSRGFGEIWLQASDMGRSVYEKLGFAAEGILRHWKLVRA